MPRMIVKSRHLRRYGKDVLVEGRQFEATEKDARFFRKAKWAEDAPIPPARPQRAEVKVEPPPATRTRVVNPNVATESAPTPLPGEYARRDMRAVE